MCQLVRFDGSANLAELVALGLSDGRVAEGWATYHHIEPGKTLIITFSFDTHDIPQAHMHYFGIRRWRHLTAGVKGSLKARLEDQKKIGRKREGGERSPAPLPDWYDLTHIAYGHWDEFGFDRNTPVFQLLPPPGAPYLNTAESLHLIQPA